MSDLITRRQFAGAVAGTSALAAISGAEADEKAKKTKEPPKKAVAEPMKADEARSTLELIVQIAKQEFPHEKLDAAAIEEIRSDVRNNLSRSKVLSKFPLTNADEPGFIFGAWRKDAVS